MANDLSQRIEKLRRSMAALDAQRAILGDEALEPALAALRQQIADLEAQQAPPSSADERRVVTILFADIVGSTALAEKLDPEEWTEIIKPAFDSLIPPVYEHGGTVARLMGDAILALFGAPDAHEDDPERAIRAGLAILTRVRAYAERLAVERGIELKVRVGINTGLVVVGNIGSNLKSEYTAMGDPINLAARLQSAASPGNILISHDTYRHVQGVFDVTPQPPLTVRGKAEPVRTYLVQRTGDSAFRVAQRGVAGIQTRTVGRDAEFKQLQSAYLEAYQHHGVVWAQLLGEPGVGKSRLLRDLREWLDLQPEELYILRGRALLGDDLHAFALVRRMWFERFQIAEDLPLSAAEANWVQGFQNLTGNDEEEPAQALGLLAGLTFEDSSHLGALRDDPQQVHGRAFVVSRELFCKLRGQRPVVIFLEDLHWADSSSWEYCLDVLGGAGIAENGLFILSTARPEWDGAATLAAQPDLSDVPVNLSPLSDEASAELTMELLNRVEGVPESVVRTVVERSEGVPYFTEELVNLFIDRGVIDASREPWHFVPERLQSLPLPATLQHLLHTRVLALPEPQRICLQRSSVFGRSFWEGGLQALGVADPGNLLNPLQPRGFVNAHSQSSFNSEHEWGFHHALLRDVTYESVLKRDRLRLHQEVAGWLQAQAEEAGRLDEFAGALAEHTESAGDLRAAARWYERAGEHAIAQGATREALQFLTRALDLTTEDTMQRWSILLAREEVLGILGQAEERKRDVLALLELARTSGDDAKLAQALHRHAYLLVFSGDYTACLDACEQALTAAHACGDESLQALLLSLKVPALVRSGRMEEGRQAAELALARVRELDDCRVRTVALLRIGVYYFESGDLAGYIELMTQQIQAARELGNRIQEIIGLSNLGESYARLGLYRQARTQLEQARTLAESIGARRFRALAIWNLGSAHLQLGHARNAQVLLEEALNEFIATGDTYGEGGTLLQIGLVLEQSGDLARALRRYGEARNRLGAIGLVGGVHQALAGLARCALKQGQLDQVRQQIEPVVAYLEQHGREDEDPFRLYQTCVEIHLALNENEKARTLARAGLKTLQARADAVCEPEWRRSMLTNVPENAALVQLARRLKIDVS